MSDTWFDPTFIKNYTRDILPHINSLEEGFFLQKERREQAIERFMARKKRDREIRTARNRVRQQRAAHAADRGKAREMDIKTGQPVSGKNSGGFYESVDSIVENEQSGKTKKHNEKFRGFDDFRKDFRLSTRTSLTGDDKEKDKLRKREERRLQELFSIQSIKGLNEQEEERPEEQPADDQQQEETPEGEGDVPEEGLVPPSFEQMFEELKVLRSRVKNVFENLSNISYKVLSENFGVRSSNKDDRDFQIENAIITISRICSGASDQEVQYLQQFNNGRFFDFNEEAFDIARKLLLELGEMCFQNLMHIDELGTQPDVPGYGRTQILCGPNTFKIVTGKVYIKESTASPNYGIKLQNAINTIIPFAVPNNPETSQFDQINMFIEPLRQQLFTFSNILVDDMNPELNTPEGIQILNSYGLIQNGTIPENAKLSVFNNTIKVYSDQIKTDINTFKKSMFMENLKIMLTRYFLVGINQIDPRNNATHLLSDNGLFLLNDDLLNSYAKSSDLKIKLKSSLKSSYGRKEKGSKLSKSLEKNRTIVEQILDQMQPVLTPDQILVNTADMIQNLNSIFYSMVLQDFDIEFSLSLNPGNLITTKQKEKNEYNIIKIKDKEYRVPVKMDKGDMSTQTIKEEFETLFSLKQKRDLVIEKLEGHEKHYSKKTSHHRSNRNKARRAAEKKWGKAAIKGKDVDHKDGNPMNNSPSNLRLRNPSDNRADNGHHKGEPYKKAKRGITNTYKGKDK
jgi:hypothetical protein